jgi:hypothetical protein
VAWPFTSVGPPNLDTGPGIAVPLASTVVTGAVAWLTGAHFTNDGSNFATILVTDTAGSVVCKLKIPPGGEQPYEWPFRPVTGVKWSADLVGVHAQIWGYV